MLFVSISDNLVSPWPAKTIALQAINPKSTSLTTENGGSFVNGPTTFMITDNLEMKPASVSKDISAIRKYNNVEVITVAMGEREVSD